MCYDNTNQILNQNKSIPAAYIFLKRSYLKYPSQVLHERSSSVKGVEQGFSVKRVNYDYQEIKNLHSYQEKSYWALKGRECCQ